MKQFIKKSSQEISDGFNETIYKLRLTSYKIDYDNLDSLNVEFSDVTYGLNSASDIQSILSQAQWICYC